MASPLDIFKASMDGADRGRERGLAQLLGKAYAAPKEQRSSILGQVAQLGAPQAAFNAETHFQSMDDNARKRFADYALAFQALPDEQKPMAYPQFAQQAQTLGIPAPTEWRPEFAPNIQKLAQALGGGQQGTPAGVQEFQFLTQGLEGPDALRARRIALGLDPRASSAAIQYKEVVGADGKTRIVAVDPREVGAHVIGGGQMFGSGVPSPGSPLNPSQQFPQLAQAYGAQITSTTRSPERNAQVNGVPNSFHLTGQAGDFVVPQQNKPAFMAQARQMGWEAIDEGDHIHLEPPPGASANPFVSQSPQERKFAEESGTQAARLSVLPQQGEIEARNAALKAQAEAAAKNEAEIGLLDAKRTRSADDTLSLLDNAEALIKKSTGSGIGSLVDAGAALFGQSTEGAEAIASLRTVAGQLVSKMPRMEGPQSDRDVTLYIQMAGDLANPNLPREQRLAAAATIRMLNERYSSDPKQPDAPRGIAIPVNDTSDEDLIGKYL